MTATHASNEIRITRLYDAPLKTVWEAWTEPEQLAQWWGPRGFTITTYGKETRVGGSWRYTMHGPDGTDYESTARYLEVEPLRKLVYDHGGHEDRPPLFRVTALFSDAGGGKTKMELISTLPTAEAAVEIRKFIKQAGGDSTWDRLAEYLEQDASGTGKFVIARAFEVPLATMFELWTSPKHLGQWLPPAGFSMEFVDCDIRAGGASFYWMGNGAVKMYGKTRYLAIERPHRIVYTQQFADEKGNVARHPLSPTWPETMLTTVDFAEEGPGRTRVKITWQPYGPATREEIETFLKAKGGMTQGWTGSLDKLEACLPSV